MKDRGENYGEIL